MATPQENATELLKQLDKAGTSTLNGIVVPGTKFIDAVAHRAVAMLRAAEAQSKKK